MTTPAGAQQDAFAHIVGLDAAPDEAAVEAAVLDEPAPRDPALVGFVLFTSLTLLGFLSIGLGWRVAARTLFVPFQVPALVSGAMGGLALIVLGTGLLTVHAGRRLAALERADNDELLDEAGQLLDAVRRRTA